MSSELISLILVSGASLLNILLTFYLSNKRVKPEIERMQAERIESYAEAGESLMQGAHLSNELLMDRIKDVLQQRDNWRSYAHILQKQIEALNATPIPFDTGELMKGQKE